MRIINWLCLTGLVIASTGYAADPVKEGKKFAQDMNSVKVNNAAKTVDPNTAIPNYAGSSPAETGYYSKGATIENEAASKAATDPNAQFIKSGINNRPKLGITESDPIFKREAAISANAHSLSDTYSGCVDLPAGTKATSWTDASCSVDGSRRNINFACEKTVRYQCTNNSVNERDPFGVHDFGAGGWNKRGVSPDGKTFWFGDKNDWRVNKKSCQSYSSSISLHVDELDRFGKLNITFLEYDDWVDIVVNGKNIFSGRGPNQGVNLGEYYVEKYRVKKPVTPPITPPITPPTKPPFNPNPDIPVIIQSQPIDADAVALNAVDPCYDCKSAPDKGDILVGEDSTYWYYEKRIPWACEYNANFNTGGIDIRSHLKEGSNTIEVINRVGGGGGVYLELQGERLKSCNKKEHTEMICDAGQTYIGATLTGSTCIDFSPPNASGYSIGGCAKYKETYTKLSEPVFDKEGQCAVNEANGCEVIGSECIAKSVEGFCIKQQLKYRCPVSTADRKVSMCGSQLICPDGNCTADVGQTSEDATDDFKEAATGLAVAQEIAKYADENNLKVFTGQAMKCHDSAIGFSNCCNDSGWGVDVGLASCSSEEKTLGMAKEAGKTVYVGSYKSGFLGTTKYKAYCTFPSKLARIIMEQGKPQIPSDFGAAKSPNCAGLSLTELQKINFDLINFTEFYPDVMLKESNTLKPSVPDETKKIENKIKAITGGGN